VVVSVYVAPHALHGLPASRCCRGSLHFALQAKPSKKLTARSVTPALPRHHERYAAAAASRGQPGCVGRATDVTAEIRPRARCREALARLRLEAGHRKDEGLLARKPSWSCCRSGSWKSCCSMPPRPRHHPDVVAKRIEVEPGSPPSRWLHLLPAARAGGFVRAHDLGQRHRRRSSQVRNLKERESVWPRRRMGASWRRGWRAAVAAHKVARNGLLVVLRAAVPIGLTSEMIAGGQQLPRSRRFTCLTGFAKHRCRAYKNLCRGLSRALARQSLAQSCQGWSKARISIHSSRTRARTSSFAPRDFYVSLGFPPCRRFLAEIRPSRSKKTSLSRRTATPRLALMGGRRAFAD